MGWAHFRGPEQGREGCLHLPSSSTLALPSAWPTSQELKCMGRLLNFEVLEVRVNSPAQRRCPPELRRGQARWPCQLTFPISNSKMGQ